MRLRLGIVSRRGVRGGGEPRLATRSSRTASSATSRSPASRPTSRSASRRRVCWRCGWRCSGRSAHGATPWLGDNAVVKAVEVFRGIESLPFARQSSAALRPALDQPGPDLGRRRAEQSARYLRHRRRRALPARTGPRGDPRAGEEPARTRACSRPSAARPRWSRQESPFVVGLCEATSPHHPERVMSVGRDGASDAVSFLSVGVPAVEFGPVGDGHHGPEEWVSVASLRSYRQALEGFVGTSRGWCRRDAGQGAGKGLRRRARVRARTTEAEAAGEEARAADALRRTEEYELGDDFDEEELPAEDELAAEEDLEEEELDERAARGRRGRRGAGRGRGAGLRRRGRAEPGDQRRDPGVGRARGGRATGRGREDVRALGGRGRRGGRQQGPLGGHLGIRGGPRREGHLGLQGGRPGGSASRCGRGS